MSNIEACRNWTRLDNV